MKTLREVPEMKCLEAKVCLASQGMGSPFEDPFLSGIQSQLCHLSVCLNFPLHTVEGTHSNPEAS